ncbi:MAG: helix-turn-helix domain-containing protein [Campylobacter sp.]|uniref:helix-turn-helix domain-containing protein n=2 Tax=Campylobacteraceae TaxID=72294 RepID=UPI0026DF269E|nr:MULTISPECIES: helix-turn-helix domain-containing protein [Campylobacter]MCI6694735.1 helix-turn-helix domain-containing protein [Campylobacter sp.]MDO2407888.1 helix-turn-helix domain-containing protein [Campylobacter magnus]
MKEISLQNEAWMTPKELEAQYGITEGAQYKLRMNKNYEVSACNNPIPFVRVGKRVLYYKSDIENWLLSQRKGAINM